MNFSSSWSLKKGWIIPHPHICFSWRAPSETASDTSESWGTRDVVRTSTLLSDFPQSLECMLFQWQLQIFLLSLGSPQHSNIHTNLQSSSPSAFNQVVLDKLLAFWPISSLDPCPSTPHIRPALFNGHECLLSHSSFILISFRLVYLCTLVDSVCKVLWSGRGE